MPYKCVHCSKIYEDVAKQIMEGCDNGACRSKFFFYLKEEQLRKISEQKEEEFELELEEKEQIERDVREIAGFEDEEKPVFLDFESIKVLKSGKYLVDLSNLFSVDKPRVYKLEDGKYIIDLSGMKKNQGQT